MSLPWDHPATTLTAFPKELLIKILLNCSSVIDLPELVEKASILPARVVMQPHGDARAFGLRSTMIVHTALDMLDSIVNYLEYTIVDCPQCDADVLEEERHSSDLQYFTGRLLSCATCDARICGFCAVDERGICVFEQHGRHIQELGKYCQKCKPAPPQPSPAV